MDVFVSDATSTLAGHFLSDKSTNRHTRSSYRDDLISYPHRLDISVTYVGGISPPVVRGRWRVAAQRGSFILSPGTSR